MYEKRVLLKIAKRQLLQSLVKQFRLNTVPNKVQCDLFLWVKIITLEEVSVQHLLLSFIPSSIIKTPLTNIQP